MRTASGATAVQIAESVGGRRRIVAHVGSAHTEAELGQLLVRARELLDDAAQTRFDLGVEPTPRPVPLVAQPADLTLPVSQEPDAPPTSVNGGSARVTATSSRVLFEALTTVFADLGFSTAVGDSVFRDLVLARVVEPTSLLDVGRVLTDLGQRPASYATMKRTLGRCLTGGYRDLIASQCFEHVVTTGDISLCMYDVTTLYFEAEHEDALRKVGYSKERRVDPQVVVGLLVDRNGFPLEIGCFEGNKAECDTRSHALSGSRRRRHRW